jgi:hypothetical protein
MSISTIRHGEPLYVVIMRDPRATALFKAWISDNRIKNCQIQENKMNMYDHYSLSMFMVTWTEWTNVVVWDAWNRRHIWTT